jgi:hypothetical protein
MEDQTETVQEQAVGLNICTYERGNNRRTEINYIMRGFIMCALRQPLIQG